MFPLYKKVLAAAQLKRLGEHKYKCDSCSLMDPHLQIYWNWLVSLVPIWLAPNLITIVGLAVNILTTLVLVWFSPTGQSGAPQWAFLLCAVGLFVYQSLDAIDGKQARRTDSSSPLGELFDHGCDSVSTVFVAVSACVAVQLGHFPTIMFFQCFCAITLFYCAHWQTYVSGVLRLGRVDVTEAQFTIMFIHMISAVFGSEIWSTKLPWVDTQLKMVPGVIGVCLAVYIFYSNMAVIFTGGVGKNGSSVAGTSVLSPIIPLLTVIIPALIIWLKSEQNLYENHPVLYITTFGLVAAKVTNRLIVAHMTKSEMEYFDNSLIGPGLLFLNQYFNFFITEYYVLWVCLIIVVVDLYLYSRQVCKEICDHLHIKLFSIPARENLSHHSTKNVLKVDAESKGADSIDKVPLLDTESSEDL